MYIESNPVKNYCNVGDLSLILGSGSSPGKGNGYPLQYSCLDNSMDRGAWQATVEGMWSIYIVHIQSVASQLAMIERLSLSLFTYN